MTKPTSDSGKPTVLVVCAVDVMPWLLLRSKLHALRDAGVDVHVACACGRYAPRLAAAGFVVHHIPFKRRLNPFANALALISLIGLMRRERFRLAITNGPVAAAVGRAASAISGTPVVNAVHGFYFHEGMAPPLRWLFVAAEYLLGRLTDGFLFVSDEDRRFAIAKGIAPRADLAFTVWNGVDLECFHPGPQQSRPLSPPFTIGIVARIVREKGYQEFLDMASTLVEDGMPVRFLVVGNSLPSDRDQFDAAFIQLVKTAGLEPRFDFRGFTDEVAECYREMDIFVLPSYREGLPVSLIEAMASGLPVVATDIRGCREVVSHGISGLLVPPRDSAALRDAVARILLDAGLARMLGDAARREAVARFDDRIVCRNFLELLRRFGLTSLDLA